MRTLDEVGRLRVVEMLWEIAFADGAITEIEHHVLWRVADLLAVSPNDRIALRQRVAEKPPARRNHERSFRPVPGRADHRRLGRPAMGLCAAVKTPDFGTSCWQFTIELYTSRKARDACLWRKLPLSQTFRLVSP
jgi:hypothetical protein